MSTHSVYELEDWHEPGPACEGYAPHSHLGGGGWDAIGWRMADERVYDPETGAVKADGLKPRVDLIPVAPLLDMALVLDFGAKKYAERNWERGFDWSRVYSAALRHLMAFWNGEDLDEETGLPHVAHALCCVAFLAEYGHTGAGRDDRPRRATTRLEEK